MFGVDKVTELIPCNVIAVSEDGNRISVSPWGDDAVIPAIPLSPIPTNLEDGRRMQGVPTPTTNYQRGDSCLCANVNGRYYIVGYFNQPLSSTGETATLVPDSENIKPLENGFIIKLSQTGQVIYRKSNQIITWLGSWGNEKLAGLDLFDDSRDEAKHTKFANIFVRAWGGLTKWVRKPSEDDEYINWKTEHVSVRTRSHEPDELTDYDLDQQARNDAIDDTTPPISDTQPDPQNPADLNYIDKVIKRSGSIKDNTHVYEREVRQSKEEDKEKTVFTRLREGHRSGILSEYETIDTLMYTETQELRGANMNDLGHIMENNYYQRDAEGAIAQRYEESFGVTDEHLYKHHVMDDAAGNYTTIQQTPDGRVISIGNTDGEQFNMTVGYDGSTTITIAPDSPLYIDSNAIDIGTDADTAMVRYTELMALIDKLYELIKNHDHNTGVGPSTPASAGVYFAAQTAILDAPDTTPGSVAKLKLDSASTNTNVK